MFILCSIIVMGLTGMVFMLTRPPKNSGSDERRDNILYTLTAAFLMYFIVFAAVCLHTILSH